MQLGLRPRNRIFPVEWSTWQFHERVAISILVRERIRDIKCKGDPTVFTDPDAEEAEGAKTTSRREVLQIIDELRELRSI